MKGTGVLLLGSWLAIFVHLHAKHLDLALDITRLFVIAAVFIFILDALLSLGLLGDHGHDFVVKLILACHWRAQGVNRAQVINDVSCRYCRTKGLL